MLNLCSWWKSSFLTDVARQKSQIKPARPTSQPARSTSAIRVPHTSIRVPHTSNPRAPHPNPRAPKFILHVPNLICMQKNLICPLKMVASRSGINPCHWFSWETQFISSNSAFFKKKKWQDRVSGTLLNACSSSGGWVGGIWIGVGSPDHFSFFYDGLSLCSPTSYDTAFVGDKFLYK